MNPYEAIVMGVSAGGLNALSQLLPNLPAEGMPPLIIVQHRANDSDDFLATHLNSICNLTVKEAEYGESLCPGTVYIAPAGYHLEVDANHCLNLSIDPPLNYSRPSIDVLFSSAAAVFADRVIAAILTGSNNDGAAGAKMIQKKGGQVYVQDPQTAEMNEMPLAAIHSVPEAQVVTLDRMGDLLIQMVRSEQVGQTKIDCDGTSIHRIGSKVLYSHDNPKVLVVDDRPDNLYAMEQMLKGSEITLIKAKSGLEAIAKVRQHSFALILMDVQMPEMNGIEVASMIQNEASGQEIPIIFVTAVDKNEHHQFRGYQAGAVDFLYKPIQSDILRSKVGVFLRMHRQRQQLEKEILERKRTEEALREYSVALETSNQILSEFHKTVVSAGSHSSNFLAEISHELRTPMTAILGCTEVLMDEPDPETSEFATCTVKRNGDQLLAMIENLLDLLKIESGSTEIELIGSSAQDIISDAASKVHEQAEAKNLDLRFEFFDESSLSVRTDPDRLRQILVNVLNNVIKFSETDSISILTRIASGAKDASMLEIQVCDGICDQDLLSFKPTSEQADSSNAYRLDRIGIIVGEATAKLLGGGLWFAKSDGQGCVFTIAVEIGASSEQQTTEDPDHDTHGKQENTESSGRSAGQKYRVLLAEDGVDNQRLLSRILKKDGAEVELADNGQNACELALTARDSGQPFEIILMDMQMPVMDGYAAARKLRESNYTGPIIALTGNAMVGDDQHCKDSGCDGYAIKPINRDDLLATIAQFLG